MDLPSFAAVGKRRRTCDTLEMPLARFYLPAVEWTADELCLAGDEALHCSRVLRKQAGDEVEVFDGAGRVATGVIASVAKATVTVRRVRECRHDRPAGAVHLLPA